MIGWIAICPRHHTVLTRTCPSCNRRLFWRGLRERQIIEMHRCLRCGSLLIGAQSTPAIEAALDLQNAMLALKRSAAAEMSGMGIIDWAAFTVILDFVQRSIWVKPRDSAREELFALILANLALDPETRLNFDWRGNYGLLVIMAWMLADWPDRLLQALDLLNVPTANDILDELQDVDDATRKRVLHTMGCARDHRPKPESWQLWLANLVAVGTDFRALARNEPNWARRDRLIALALLSEGRTIAETAYDVRVSTNMVQRWLEIGVAYGLSAVTAKTLRICDLTVDQKTAIAAWLRESDRAHSGPTGWSYEHARAEITAKFGLVITSNTARSFLMDIRQSYKRQ